MKKSTTGLLIGSALVVGLSGCASSASQSSGQAGANSGQSWYQHPAVCGLAGSIIGGSIGYATSSSSDEDAGAATGAAAGAAIGGLLCADRTPEPVAPQCPSYGEVPAGVAVDAEGCPLDSDNDGVPDYRDQCPNTPAGVDVNALGCPESVVLQDVNFEFDSAQLTPNAQNVLNGVAERLVNNPDVRVSIEGHTDSRGSDQYNKDLSQRRAESVATYLNQRGVEANRMRAVGYGEERPVATNDTEEGRFQNRRVELDEWK